MKTRDRSVQISSLIVILFLLSACAPSLTSTPAAVEAVVSTDIPVDTATSAPVVPAGYQPVSAEVCQILQEGAAQSLGLTFTMESGTPFTDYVSGEAGQGCTLTANTNGASISDPSDALSKLVDGFIGWEEQSAYAAGGPEGAGTGMTRDAGLMLLSVGWQPSADANCPTDQPIASCPLAPAQKLYTVTIQAAQK
jgi:hypothetical protein